MYTTPFIFSVTFIFSSRVDTVPPCRPGTVVFTNPLTGIPSTHQDNLAGGLLELESQINDASSFGFNSAGSCRILTCSGGSEIEVKTIFVNNWFQETYSKRSSLQKQKVAALLQNSQLHICI